MHAASEVVTVSFTIKPIAPAAGDRLLARGRVLRTRRTITVCQGEAPCAAAMRNWPRCERHEQRVIP
jgi:acyl-coenzyme A thioesterase PaaI-like protein